MTEHVAVEKLEPPERIWLQVPAEDGEMVEDWWMHDVTWAETPIENRDSVDIEYVRRDVAVRLREALRAQCGRPWVIEALMVKTAYLEAPCESETG